jgi:NAD(P)-dependent dehydrogenase (short-subunit alcohol dehydrogenase family)
VHEGEGRSDTEGVALPGSLDTTVAAIDAAGTEGFAVRMDVLDRSRCSTASDAVMNRFGRIDVLVNNAIYQVSEPWSSSTTSPRKTCIASSKATSTRSSR